MNHIDAEMSDIVVVMDDCPTSKIDTLVENLKKAGLEVSDVDANNGVVEGTILSASVKSLQQVPCVKYVRSVFNYIADFPTGDARNLDTDERVSEDIPQ